MTDQMAFLLAQEIVEQDSVYCTRSLNMDSLFTNIPLKETITRCTKSIYNRDHTAEALSKSELKKLLSLATKESSFIFNKSLYNQTDGIAMGSPIKSTLVNKLPCFYGKVS